MRRTLLITLLAGLLAPVALAGPGAGADGTLSVRSGDGRVVLLGFKGAAIGRIETGQLMIVEPKNDDCVSPLVWNWETAEIVFLPGLEPDEDRLACVYRGSQMRFRLVGAGPEIRLRGIGIGASIVGRGTAVLDGDGGFFDGLYSLDGEDYRSLPDRPQRFQLGTPAIGG